MSELKYSDILEGYTQNVDIPYNNQFKNSKYIIPDYINYTLDPNYDYRQYFVYNNKIYTRGKYYFYSWDGISQDWIQEMPLPYDYQKACVFAYKNQIHMLGGKNDSKNHYHWNGDKWIKDPDLNYSLYNEYTPVIYNDTLYIIGSSMYKYNEDNGNLTSISKPTYAYCNHGQAVVYNGLIYVIGGDSTVSGNNTYYTYDGSNWTQYNDFPVKIYTQHVTTAVYNNKLYAITTNGNYVFDGNQWSSAMNSPTSIYGSYGNAVTYNNQIYIFNKNEYYIYTDNYCLCNFYIPTDEGDNAIHFKNKLYCFNTRFGTESNNIYSGTIVVYSFDGQKSMVETSSKSPYRYKKINRLIVHNNKIHLLGFNFSNNTANTAHLTFDGNVWEQKSALPVAFQYGAAVSYQNKLHIFGSSNSSYYKKHFIWDDINDEWQEESNVPYNLNGYRSIVCNDKVYFFLSDSTSWKSVIIWDGTNWTTTTHTCVTNSTLEVINNEIYFIQSNYLYKWDIINNDIPEKIEPCLPFYANSLTLFFNEDKIYVFPYQSDTDVIGKYTYYNNDGWYYDIYKFTHGSSIVYNNKIHIFGGYVETQYFGSDKHYSFDGNNWKEESRLPYYFRDGSVVVYNNKIHILGGNTNGKDVNNYTQNPRKNHYSWDGIKWEKESDLPYDFYQGVAIVYNNKIHILGTKSNTDSQNSHYSWDGEEWKSETNIPRAFSDGSAVIYDNKIHLMISNLHYSFSDNKWNQEDNLPIVVGVNSAVIYNDQMHIMDNNHHYKYNSQIQKWVKELDLPYEFNNGSSVIYNEEIYILSLTKNYKTSYISYTGINEVILGENNLLNIKDDTLLSENDLTQGIIAHNKEGKPIQGIRPKFYKYESSLKALVLDIPIQASTTGDVDAFYLKDQMIKLRINGTNIQLVSIKTDGTTESVVSIATNVGASYSPDFKILRVHYFNANLVLFEYQYPTSATALTAITLRFATLKYDDTLTVGGTAVISAVTSATVDIEAKLIPGMYDDYTSVRKAITISTGAYSLVTYPYYMSYQTPLITYVNTSTVNIASNINTYIPNLNVCPDKGGFFYNNASNVGYVYLFPNYYSTTPRAISISDVYNYNSISVPSALRHHILGFTKNGLLVTITEGTPDTDGDTAGKMYLFIYDHTNTTKLLTLQKRFPLKQFFGSYTQLMYTSDSNSPFYNRSYDHGTLISYKNTLYFFNTIQNNTLSLYTSSLPGKSWMQRSSNITILGNVGAIVYKDVLHVFGVYYGGVFTHCYTSGDNQWIQENIPEIDAQTTDTYVGAVIHNNEIHIILGNSYVHNLHYSWNGTTWTKHETTATIFTRSMSIVEYDNKIHLLDGTLHYSWENDINGWIEEPALPYSFKKGSPVVYGGKIHIFNSPDYDGNENRNHYVYDGKTWIKLENLPQKFPVLGATVAGDLIYLIGPNTIVYGQSQTTYVYKLYSSYRILSFENDILLYDDGKRYQITNDGLMSLEPIEIEHVDKISNYDCIGSESSPFNGVFIYGD